MKISFGFFFLLISKFYSSSSIILRNVRKQVHGVLELQYVKNHTNTTGFALIVHLQ